MTRSTHRRTVVLSRRPVEVFGPRAAAVTADAVVEATLRGDPLPPLATALDAAVAVLSATDLTGWFAEPFYGELTRWLDARLRPVADGCGRHLLSVAVATADLRIEFAPA